MKQLLVICSCILILAVSAHAQPPAWENSVNLGNLSMTSMASDAYGQHVVGVTGGAVKHYLYGNDGSLIYNTLSVSSGEYPVVTSYGGKVRVTMKVGSYVKIYQSTDGGSTWPTTYQYLPSPSNIYNIDAFSDANGTHVTWESDAACDQDDEIYYILYDDDEPGFVHFKNVTDLSSPSTGFQPKVTATSDEAHVVFCGSDLVMTSRDLYLPSGTWESNYVRLGGSYPIEYWLTSTSIGDSVYVIGFTDPYVPGVMFTRRHKSATTWRDAVNISQGSYFCPEYGPIKELTAFGGQLHLTTYESSYGITYRSYTPGNWWSNSEVVASPSSSILKNTVITSASPVGIYCAWFDNVSGSPRRYIRRKPLAITGTLSGRTFLTGNNWFSGGSAAIASGVSVDGRSGSTTTLLNGTTLSNSGTFTALSGATITMNTSSALVQNGTFTVNSGATMNIQPGCLSLFGAAKWLTINGALSAVGTSGSPITFTANTGNPYPGYWSSVKLAGGPNTVRYCNINYASWGLYVNNTSTNTIEYCNIHSSMNYGLLAVNTSQNYRYTIVNQCDISDDNSNGALIQNARIDFIHSALEDNTNHGVVHNAAGKSYYEYTTISGNSKDGIFLNASTA